MSTDNNGNYYFIMGSINNLLKKSVLVYSRTLDVKNYKIRNLTVIILVHY